MKEVKKFSKSFDRYYISVRRNTGVKTLSELGWTPGNFKLITHHWPIVARGVLTRCFGFVLILATKLFI